MYSRPHVGNAQLFAAHAGDNLEIWQALIGQQVVHFERGQGVVIGVRHGSIELDSLANGSGARIGSSVRKVPQLELISSSRLSSTTGPN
jgi:hypothetical protein